MGPLHHADGSSLVAATSMGAVITVCPKLDPTMSPSSSSDDVTNAMTTSFDGGFASSGCSGGGGESACKRPRYCTAFISCTIQFITASEISILRNRRHYHTI